MATPFVRNLQESECVKKEEVYTIEDIYALPEGERAELIDGQIYLMAPSSTNHQRILNYINTEINRYIRKNNGICCIMKKSR